MPRRGRREQPRGGLGGTSRGGLREAPPPGRVGPAQCLERGASRRLPRESTQDLRDALLLTNGRAGLVRAGEREVDEVLDGPAADGRERFLDSRRVARDVGVVTHDYAASMCMPSTMSRSSRSPPNIVFE